MILFGDSRQQPFTKDLKGRPRQPHELIWAGHVHIMALPGEEAYRCSLGRARIFLYPAPWEYFTYPATSPVRS